MTMAVIFSTKTDRIVHFAEENLMDGEGNPVHTFVYQQLEDDHGGGHRWVDHEWGSFEQLTFGLTRGWNDLYPLWKEGIEPLVRQPTNEEDVLRFAVGPLQEHDTETLHYVVAFGCNRARNGFFWNHKTNNRHVPPACVARRSRLRSAKGPGLGGGASAS